LAHSLHGRPSCPKYKEITFLTIILSRVIASYKQCEIMKPGLDCISQRKIFRNFILNKPMFSYIILKMTIIFIINICKRIIFLQLLPFLQQCHVHPKSMNNKLILTSVVPYIEIQSITILQNFLILTIKRVG